MTSKTLVGTAVAVLTLTAALTACGAQGGTSTGGSAPSSSAAQTNDHNQADVTFAQQMIPHHQQALDMAAMVTGHTTNAKVIDLAGRIQRAQGPEIQQMSGWLTAWGASPNTGMDMPGMTGQSMPGMSTAPASGMMSADDMARLGRAHGADFDRMWLSMMIQHHQGAIAMATTELAQGANTDAKTLAQKIITGQRAEIAEMNGLLGQS